MKLIFSSRSREGISFFVMPLFLFASFSPFLGGHFVFHNVPPIVSPRFFH
jgi:hypothetical protein